jgi:hypothetical protein
MIGLLLAASAAASLSQCVSTQAVALAQSSSEPADTVIQRMFEQNRAIGEQQLRNQVYGNAFEAIERARHGN